MVQLVAARALTAATYSFAFIDVGADGIVPTAFPSWCTNARVLVDVVNAVRITPTIHSFAVVNVGTDLVVASACPP